MIFILICVIYKVPIEDKFPFNATKPKMWQYFSNAVLTMHLFLSQSKKHFIIINKYEKDFSRFKACKVENQSVLIMTKHKNHNSMIIIIGTKNLLVSNGSTDNYQN